MPVRYYIIHRLGHRLRHIMTDGAHRYHIITVRRIISFRPSAPDVRTNISKWIFYIRCPCPMTYTFRFITSVSAGRVTVQDSFIATTRRCLLCMGRHYRFCTGASTGISGLLDDDFARGRIAEIFSGSRLSVFRDPRFSSDFPRGLFRTRVQI